MAALYAASRDVSEQPMKTLHARDLSKKGGLGRQFDYAQRTAIKALSTVQPLH
jgi:hypothetical protein